MIVPQQITPPPPPTWLDPAVFLTDLAWTLIRTIVTFIISFGIGLASLGVLDRLTPGVREVNNIRNHPIAVALFALGIFIFLTFSLLGAVISPLPIGITSGLGPTVSPVLIFAYRITALLAGFLLSLFFAFIYYRILAHLRPFGIDLDEIDKDAVATGIYVLGYLIFLGAIIYMALVIPA